ncbi:MAG: biotin synthase [Saprospiraceae bacterium]|jgi:biotin synthase
MSTPSKQLTFEEVMEIYNRPLLELVYQAATVHRKNHDPQEVQISTLLSIKTGGCSEDCGYCPQAARYHTGVETNDLLSVKQVEISAKRAKLLGSSRLCMGAAWRNVKDDSDFDHVLELVKTVNNLDMEVCCTLGMVTENQAKKLSDAGLYAYNHNLDTSEEYYKEVISTRGYQDRLDTIDNVRKAGLTVCSGGIIGMGESAEDRCKMLVTLANLSPQPESVPINALVAVEGTPMEEQKPISIWEMVRMVAVTRMVMPRTTVRLSAGRTEMSIEGQALCFMAGAASIFAGDKLLTTPNPDIYGDLDMFDILGLKPRKPFTKQEKPQPEKSADYDLKEKPRWTRPGHKIEANEAKRVKKVVEF